MSEIERLLAEAAEADRNLGPSPEVQRALRQSVRAQRPRRPWGWAAAAAAAAALAAVGLFLSQSPEPQTTAVIESAPIQTTEFFVLDPVRPIEEMHSGRLVRVTLPADAPDYFGLPMGGRSGPVEADVLLGDDGIARAVRFIR